jgi:hypothetical protein
MNLSLIFLFHQIIGLKKKFSYWIFALQWGIGLKKKALEFSPIFVFFFPLKISNFK